MFCDISCHKLLKKLLRRSWIYAGFATFFIVMTMAVNYRYGFIITVSHFGKILDVPQRKSPMKYQLQTGNSELSATELRTWNYLHNNYLCSPKNGRLGNQLFQFAATYGIARKTNKTLTIGTVDMVYKYFKITNAVPIDRIKYAKQWPVVREKRGCDHDITIYSRVIHLSNCRVGAYLQSWHYFGEFLMELKKQLKFKQYIEVAAENIMGNISNKYTCKRCLFENTDVVYVGIHVRRGDIFRKERLHRYGYRIANDDYILRAMSYFIYSYKHVVFIICSDSIRWLKRFVKENKNKNIEFVHEKSYIDLAVLSSCNHTIMTVGTFGWWAGFLSGGEVIYYKHPVSENSPLRKQYGQIVSDYYLPKWIPME